MINVYLHGDLGEKLGNEWRFEARSPSEVFDAIDANTDGKLLKYMWEKEKEGLKYYIFLDNDGIKEEQLSINLESKEEMHVVPAIEGADGFFEELWEDEMFMIGAISIGVGVGLKALGGWSALNTSKWFPGDGTWGELIGGMGDVGIELGVALVMQGIINVLQDDPEHPDNTDDPQPGTESFIFDNPENTVMQGVVVPVGYGRLRVGSNVVSTALLNTRLVNFNSIDIESATDPESLGGQTDIVQHVDLNRTVDRVTIQT